ncbi:Phycocyanobilin lyase alpha subunit [Richelia intracellularis]|nr:Phycocyanobilin lyase alpha subunit [Richelia intracellularis]
MVRNPGAAQSLEMLGDIQGFASLTDLLQIGLQGEQLIPDQPDFSQPYDAILDALATLKDQDCISLIMPFLDHPFERIQYSAARALYQLTRQDIYGERLIEALRGDDLQLRRAALADIGAIGYLPGAEEIAETLAENSLKLIALKGLFENTVDKDPSLHL